MHFLLSQKTPSHIEFNVRPFPSVAQYCQCRHSVIACSCRHCVLLPSFDALYCSFLGVNFIIQIAKVLDRISWCNMISTKILCCEWKWTRSDANALLSMRQQSFTSKVAFDLLHSRKLREFNTKFSIEEHTAQNWRNRFEKTMKLQTLSLPTELIHRYYHE